MRTIHIGYTTEKSGHELLEFFDYDESHPEGLSRFEQTIGCSPMRPEGYEAYDRDVVGDEIFNRKIFEKYSPFRVTDQSVIDRIDFTTARCVFFIETDEPRGREADGVHFVGCLTISGYDFE